MFFDGDGGARMLTAGGSVSTSKLTGPLLPSALPDAALLGRVGREAVLAVRERVLSVLVDQFPPEAVGARFREFCGAFEHVDDHFGFFAGGP